MGIGRREVLAGSAALLAAPSIARAQAQNGVALVIGNSKYLWEAALANVKRDAPDVARRVQALGLRTDLIMDASAAVHVLSNATGSWHAGTRPDLEHRLVQQVTGTVRWVDNMRELLRREARVVEVGPGRPLRGFFSSLGVEIASVTSVATIAAAGA